MDDRMVPTEFGTYGLPLLGTNVVPIVNRAPYPRRVLIAQSFGLGTRVFISSIAAELSMQTGGTPGGAIALPAAVAAGIPMVIALAAGQPLFASAAAAGTRVTVSVSGDIPITRMVRDLEFTTFRTYTPRTIGTGAPVIVPSGSVPRRVTVQVEGAVNADRLFVANNAGALNNVGNAVPGQAFEIATQSAPLVFILAPRQSLYAAQAALSTLTSIFVSVSDLQTGAPQGATGIPGPDGQE